MTQTPLVRPNEHNSVPKSNHRARYGNLDGPVVNSMKSDEQTKNCHLCLGLAVGRAAERCKTEYSNDDRNQGIKSG